jgi:hypothetical protein
MDTFIALGGIATGGGAIWTAMLARRQARPTERSLAEQNERGCSVLRTVRDSGQRFRHRVRTYCIMYPHGL